MRIPVSSAVLLTNSLKQPMVATAGLFMHWMVPTMLPAWLFTMMHMEQPANIKATLMLLMTAAIPGTILTMVAFTLSSTVLPILPVSYTHLTLPTSDLV